mgnify:CR=1 FL=1|jgi:plasmid maintenance system antidote protein VapI
MVKNDFKNDFKICCLEDETTQTKIADIVGTSKSYVSRLIRQPEIIVNKTFVKLMEALDYDIELTYVKRE